MDEGGKKESYSDENQSANWIYRKGTKVQWGKVGSLILCSIALKKALFQKCPQPAKSGVSIKPGCEGAAGTPGKRGVEN